MVVLPFKFFVSDLKTKTNTFLKYTDCTCVFNNIIHTDQGETFQFLFHTKGTGKLFFTVFCYGLITIAGVETEGFVSNYHTIPAPQLHLY